MPVEPVSKRYPWPSQLKPLSFTATTYTNYINKKYVYKNMWLLNAEDVVKELYFKKSSYCIDFKTCFWEYLRRWIFLFSIKKLYFQEHIVYNYINANSFKMELQLWKLILFVHVMLYIVIKCTSYPLNTRNIGNMRVQQWYRIYIPFQTVISDRGESHRLRSYSFKIIIIKLSNSWQSNICIPCREQVLYQAARPTKPGARTEWTCTQNPASTATDAVVVANS